jgi:quinol monooxygenase YgiN
MSIIAVADMFSTSDARDELAIALEHAEREAAKRPGCIRYSFAAMLTDPNHFVLVSEWENDAALDAHYASPEFASFQFSLHDLLARESEMTVYSVSRSARPLASGPMDPRDAD